MSSQSQSQAKRGRKKLDDESFSQSQSSQNNRSSETLGPAEFERKVSEMVRYLLCQDRKKAPIKRQDINKNVMREHSRSFQSVFQKAKAELSSIFGINVVEMEVGRSKTYYLVNNLDTKDEDVISWSRDVKHSGLLMTIISLIYMSGGELSEDILRRTLKQLGIRKDIFHSQFGDIDKLIQDFVKQSYIIKEKVVCSEVVTFRYKLGPRAMAETTKRKILEFISEVYGVEIQQWRMQYKEIVEEEHAGEQQASRS